MRPRNQQRSLSDHIIKRNMAKVQELLYGPYALNNVAREFLESLERNEARLGELTLNQQRRLDRIWTECRK